MDLKNAVTSLNATAWYEQKIREENYYLFPLGYSVCLLFDSLLAFSAAFAVAF
jgi:hypothetical protein